MNIFNIRAYALVFSFLTILILQSCGDDDKNNPVDNGEVTIDKIELDFGSVEIGKAETLELTLTNSMKSEQTLNISVSGTDSSAFIPTPEENISIDADSDNKMSVKFVPTVPGEYSALLNIGEFKVILKGDAWTNSELAVAPLEIDFGVLKTGKTDNKSFKITNLSQTSVEILLSFQTNEDNAFTITTEKSLTLSPEESSDVGIEFHPTMDGQFSAAVKVDTFAIVALQGSATSVINLDLSTRGLDFGRILVGATEERTVTYENKSEIEAEVDIAIEGDDKEYFEIINNYMTTLQPGEKDSIIIRFSPTKAKEYSANITFGEDAEYKVSLTGEAYMADDLEIAPDEINFGQVQIEASRLFKITLKNISDNSVDYSTEFKTGADSSLFVESDPEGTLQAGASVQISLRFTPKNFGTINDIFTITTSNNKIYNIPVSATVNAIQDLTLDATEVYTAPTIDGDDSDPEWNETEEMYLEMNQVEPSSGDNRMIKGYLRAIYDQEYIYFLVKIEDDTKNDLPNKLVFNGGDASDDKNWKMESDGQDGIGLVFPVSYVVFGDNDEVFDEIGCMTACHTAKSLNYYESGFYPAEGTIDIWYWKAATTNPQGYADDYYASGLDGINPDRRSGDDGNEFANPNYTSTSYLPLKLPANGNNGFDKSRYLWKNSSVDFSPDNNPITGASWSIGDYVPGWLLGTQESPENGRGDIQAKGQYKDGMWVVEFRRKLETGNGDEDVTLYPGDEIPFSIAYFENIRKYSNFEYSGLNKSPKPGHFSPYPYSIILNLR